MVYSILLVTSSVYLHKKILNKKFLMASKTFLDNLVRIQELYLPITAGSLVKIWRII